jgi:hypothetical protein
MVPSWLRFSVRPGREIRRALECINRSTGEFRLVSTSPQVARFERYTDDDWGHITIDLQFELTDPMLIDLPPSLERATEVRLSPARPAGYSKHFVFRFVHTDYRSTGGPIVHEILEGGGHNVRGGTPFEVLDGQVAATSVRLLPPAAASGA